MECTTNGNPLSNQLFQTSSNQFPSGLLCRSSLTRTQLPLEANTGEVIAFTVLAGDLAKVTVVAHALTTDAFTTLVAGRFPLTGATVVLLGRTILLFRALTVGSQSTWMAAAHATFKGAITVVTAVAVRQGILLALTITIKVHHNCQAVLKAHRLDGKIFLLFLGAATCLGLNAEADLRRGTWAKSFRIYAKESSLTKSQFCS